MTLSFEIAPLQLQEKQLYLQKKHTSLHNAFLHTTDEIQRIHLTLLCAYDNLSPNDIHAYKANDLSATIQWIQYSIQDPHELLCAIQYANDSYKL